MHDPFSLMGWLLVIVIAVMLFAYFRPRKKLSKIDHVEVDHRPAAYREGGTRTFGKRTVSPVKKPTIAITPRQMESVNIKRKLRGYPPLNREGVKNAISTPWDSWRREPATTNDWLTYLILWEVFSDDHKSNTCAGTGGFTIDPNIPYNGQGGEFAGAGASGAWTDAPQDVSSAAALISTGSHFAEPTPDAPTSERVYSPGDTVSGYGSGSRSDDPTPSYTPPAASYSPPDPSPSYSSSSSSDSSSSSSSSYDSGSSGGGGGDSGGGGGGGDGS